jgi:hypothetical protein
VRLVLSLLAVWSATSAQASPASTRAARQLVLLYNEVGRENLALGRTGEAAVAYRQSIVLSPRQPDAYLGLGRALEQLNDLDGAAAAFRDYVRLEQRWSKLRQVQYAMSALVRLRVAARRHRRPSDSGLVDPFDGPWQPASYGSLVDPFAFPERERWYGPFLDPF